LDCCLSKSILYTDIMDRIVLIGLNHKTAPVEIREKFASVCVDGATPLEHISKLQPVKEVLFISTCNRMEVLFTTPLLDQGIGMVVRYLADIYGQTSAALKPYLYIHLDHDAVKHSFRVACSLDSMVVGESQILGQIKQAYRNAVEAKTSGVILNRLLHKSFSVAKRVRTETQIGSSAVSISYAAVKLAKKIFQDLQGKKAMLVGAGEMAELAAEHLLAQGVDEIIVANRTVDRALALARRFNGTTISLDELASELQQVDIIISSTGSPEPIISFQDVRKQMRARRNRPLFLIDIAVPRDIDPEVNRLDNVYLYNIDDLQGIVEMNRAERLKEATRAEHIIEAEALKFETWLRTLEVVPTIISLRRKAEEIRRAEIHRTLSQLESLPPEQIDALQVLTQSIVNKVLHDPILFLKRSSSRTQKDLYLDVARRLFSLDEDRPEVADNDVQISVGSN
jgi:glutamyl-tRNA reductase